jgi:CRISPR-associated protein Csb2
MPTAVLEKGKEKTTLVFDTWADVGDGVLAIRWDCPVDDEARSLFEVLAAGLGYLGRSESWVEAKALADDAELPKGDDAYPHLAGQQGRHGWEQVSLLAPVEAAAYTRWRMERVAVAHTGLPLPEGGKKPSRKLLKDRDKAVAAYPADLVDALQRDTAWWREHRWSQPPGSRRVLYWRRSDALSVGPPAPVARVAPAPLTTALLSLTAASDSRGLLPVAARVLPQAELLHRALVARVGGGARVECPEVTGRDNTGRPLSGHRHAHLLPVDLDRDGHLDHFIVHAPMGLGPLAQRAIRGLDRTWTKGAGELRVALVGMGGLDDLRALPAPVGESIAALLGPLGGSRMWISCTPFVLPRYQKARGANTFDGQVSSELASRGLPPARVELLRWDETNRHLRHAVRVRREPARPPPVDEGYVVRLVFDEPVLGPITLGYGAHFGLGMFVADAVP